MFKWIGIGVGIITALLLAFVAFAIFLGPEFRAAWRDVFIVILAALQLISAVLTIALLIAVLYVVNQLNKLARETIVPKIDFSVNKVNEILDNGRNVTGKVLDSTHAVSSTTTFVAERVASPIIRISSLVAGVRVAATTLARRDADKPGQAKL